MTEKMKKTYDVFISYARNESKPFAKWLNENLKEEDFSVFLDLEAMESPGVGFPQQIRTAICESERLLLIVGPEAMKKEYVRNEWQCANSPEVCTVITPIIFKGTAEIMPEELKGQNLQYVDFSSADSYENALKELKRYLKEPVKHLGALGKGCLQRPLNLLSRPDYISRLQESLIPSGAKGISTREKTVLIWGMGGVGKSVLAHMFLERCYTRRSFQDGIYWLKFTKDGDSEILLMEGIKQVAKDLKEKEVERKYTNPETCLTNFEKLIKNKNCLFVLDNIWNMDPLKAFEDSIGYNSRLVATIQDRKIAVGRPIRTRKLKPFSKKQALNFLAMWVGKEIAQLPPEATKIVERTGRLPFTLKLCGAMLSAQFPWKSLLDYCKKAKYKQLIELELLPEEYQKEYKNVYCCIKASLEVLGKEGEIGKKCVERYRDLAVFPGGETVPEAVIFSLWSKTSSNPDKDKFIPMATKLLNKALLQSDCDEPPREYSIHNLCTDYLRLLDKDGSNLKRLHGVLGRALLEWWQKNRFKIRKREDKLQESYIMKNLFTHLYRAGSWDEVKILLNDIEYLKRQQIPTRQYMFQKNFTMLLQDEEVPVEMLVEILEGVLNVISNELPLENEKADWLDSFAYWINSIKIRGKGKKTKLEEIARKFDRKCGEVSHELVRKKRKEGKNDWALRFAELRTWVYQRTGEKEDIKKCEEACRDAEKTCLLEGMEDAYRYLGRAEFIRMRGHCLSRLSRFESDETQKRNT